MGISVDWKNIKDGFRTFEELAYTYVQEKYPNSTWKKTGETRDGNKDAVALVFGYQPYPDKEEQWWMEAKYSTESLIISRYKLDATIVSAILNGSVSRIFFVTNILISTKTIMDIRTALYNALNCRDIIFCTRYTLEHWLANNNRIYHKFFNIDEEYKLVPITGSELFATQDINFYTVGGSRVSFKEPVRSLYIGESYIGYFSVFSDSKRIVALRAAPGIKGLKLLSKNKIILEPGENQIKFQFEIGKEYTQNKNERTVPIFTIGKLKVPPLRPIIPTENLKGTLTISTQIKTLEELVTGIKDFIKKSRTAIHTLEGISGAGKSHLIEQLLNRHTIDEKEDLFFGSFVQSTEKNAELFLNMILFFLFPYLAPDAITKEYIRGLNNKNISDALFDLIENKNDIESFIGALTNICENDLLIPQEISINRRFIFLDDLQKLDQVISKCLVSFLTSINQRKLPVFILLSGQPYYFNNSQEFKYLKENCVVKRHIYEIRIHDILDCFSFHKLAEDEITTKWLHALEFNVIELFIFSKYIWEESHSIKSVDELMLLCKAFRRSGIMEQHLLSKFNEFFLTNPDCKELCNLIYWSHIPFSIPPGSEKHQIAEKIVRVGLARYNSDDALIPQHDIYAECYRRHFSSPQYEEADLTTVYPLNIFTCLANVYIPSKLTKSIESVRQLIKSKNFNTVLFILQNLFETSLKQELKQKLPEEQYYELYLMYALAANQQSLTANCRALFDELINEIYHSENSNIQHICLQAMWELALLHYENMSYKIALAKLDMMMLLIKKLQRSAVLPSKMLKCLHYHDAMVADTLIKANKNEATYQLYLKRSAEMKDNGFDYRYLSFTIRYALTRCTKDMPQCIEMIEKSMIELAERYGVNDKHYNWCGFHLNFFRMIYEERHELLKDVLDYHLKMKKNHYSNYRHRLSILAMYYYSINDEMNGNKYLLKESIFSRELCARQRAFHYMALALHEAVYGSQSEAYNYLKDADQLLSELPDYKVIVIHNMNIIKSGCFSSTYICFWFGSELTVPYYYIDPRCSW
ncbi:MULTISPECIES: ATP-binding protein [Parabacteroides]|nr:MULTISPECIES: ATP-binding protein [Parabacteroides]KKB45035.1 hypothetical protein HMPREF1212_05375 [Parabacteroides sp. HGS0025]RGP13636.1 ATP-binding protein [Parabacteroides gordonii]